MNWKLIALNIGGAFLAGAALYVQGTWANGHASWPTVLVGAVCAGVIGAGHYMQGQGNPNLSKVPMAKLVDAIASHRDRVLSNADRETPVEVPHPPDSAA